MSGLQREPLPRLLLFLCPLGRLLDRGDSLVEPGEATEQVVPVRGEDTVTIESCNSDGLVWLRRRPAFQCLRLGELLFLPIVERLWRLLLLLCEDALDLGLLVRCGRALAIAAPGLLRPPVRNANEAEP